MAASHHRSATQPARRPKVAAAAAKRRADFRRGDDIAAPSPDLADVKRGVVEKVAVVGLGRALGEARAKGAANGGAPMPQVQLARAAAAAAGCLMSLRSLEDGLPDVGIQGDGASSPPPPSVVWHVLVKVGQPLVGQVWRFELEHVAGMVLNVVQLQSKRGVSTVTVSVYIPLSVSIVSHLSPSPASLHTSLQPHLTSSSRTPPACGTTNACFSGSTAMALSLPSFTAAAGSDTDRRVKVERAIEEASMDMGRALRHSSSTSLKR